MSDPYAIGEALVPAAKRLFERSRPKTIDLPDVREALRRFQVGCADAINETAALAVSVELADLKQDVGEVALKRFPDAVDIASFVSDWNAPAIVRLDRALLFRALDSMFGGDPLARRSAPERALTALEQSVAATIGRALFARLLVALSASAAGVVRVADEADELGPRAAKSEYVVAQYRAGARGDRLAVILPTTAFDRIRDLISSSEQAESRVVDPVWAQEFKRNVAATRIALEATMEGPRLLLSSLAQLQPGSLIEFSRDAMRNVVLVSGRSPVFVGRLGQSRGMLTVLLDCPAKPPGADDPPE